MYVFEAGPPSLFKKVLFILFLAAFGLCCCVRAFFSCGKQQATLVGVCRLLIVMASVTLT